MKKEYSKLVKYYDLLHDEKDYRKEAEYFTKLILTYKTTKENKLLDLACGTGEHIKYLKQHFNCEGLDISEEMIFIAQQKNTDLKFYIGDMATFNLNKKFDVITLLFNSIGYLNKKKIELLFKQVSKHLNTGGIFLIETIFLKEKLKPIKNHIRSYSNNKINIRRILNLSIDDNYAILHAKYLMNLKIIDEDKGKIVLLSESEYKKLFSTNGFKIKKRIYKSTRSSIFIGIKQ